MDANSNDDMDVRILRGCHVIPRNAYIINGLPRLFYTFTTSLYDYILYDPTSCPQRLSVRYKSSVMTQKKLVIVVLNN